MNLHNITVKQLNLATPALDPVFGEPAGGQEKVFGADLIIQGQIVYGVKDSVRRTLTGDATNANGHVTVSINELVAKGFDPLGVGTNLKKGDKITKLADVSVDYRVLEARPVGHLRGNPMLFMFFFGQDMDDKAPVTR
jgi:hypothetical protein